MLMCCVSVVIVVLFVLWGGGGGMGKGRGWFWYFNLGGYVLYGCCCDVVTMESPCGHNR